jgi:hypothetical protein
MTGRRSYQSRRTVHGVLLRRSSPDTWSAGGWSFRINEGNYLYAGACEWTAHDPTGTVTIHSSLGGAVRAMLIQERNSAP